MRSVALKVSAIFTFSLLGVGCTIAPLSHEGLASHEASRSGVVNVAERAEGLNGSKVGWGRITPFAIPVVPIYVQGDESVDLMSNIKEALETAGYTATGAAESGKTPLVLHAKVNKKRYSNYTWLAPLVPTWGGMDVTVSLVEAGGKAVWQQNFKGSGFTMNFFDGYNVASRESMTMVLDQMVAAFASDDFYNAVGGSSATASNAVSPSEQASLTDN